MIFKLIDETISKFLKLFKIISLKETYQTIQTICIGVAVFGSIIFIQRWLTAKHYNLPPGPRKLPIIGNLLYLARIRKRLHKHLIDLTKVYGPVIHMKLGSWDTVFLNDIKVVKEAMSKDYDFAGRPKIPTFIRMTNGKDLLFENVNELWKYHRKLSFSAIRSYANRECLNTIVNNCVQNVGDIMLKEENAFDMHKYCTLFVLNVMMGILFGKEMSVDDPKFISMKNVTQKALEAFNSGTLPDIFPCLDGLPFMGQTKVLKLIKPMYDLIEENFNEHVKTFDKNNPRDLIDHLLLEQKQIQAISNKDILTDENIKMICFDMFGAGIDTIVNTLHWFFGFIIEHQKIQDNIQKEITKELGSIRPMISTRGKLPYTEATIYETMRYATIAILGVPLSTMCDTTVGGYDIPKDTMIMINIGAIHCNKELWGDADVFRPERFLNNDGSLANRPSYFIPFGLGKRNCIGEVLAKNTLMIAMPGFLQRFKFSPDLTGYKTKSQEFSLVNLCCRYMCKVEERN